MDMDVAMLLPSLEALGVIGGLYAAWWAFADVVLHHIGIPFLDAGVPRERDRDRRG